MKPILFLLLVLGQTAAAIAQEPRDSVKTALTGYVLTVNKAADVFLNRQLTAEARIKAIDPYEFIYEERQVRQFKEIALNREEKPEIRATALRKIYPYVGEDEKLVAQVIQWLGDPQTPAPLRDETLALAGNLSFTVLTDVPGVYSKMLEDRDPKYRAFAASKLLISGDQRAQQLLINGLSDPKNALFPPVQAIQLLSFSPKPAYYPAVYQVLQTATDEAVRLSAIQVIGAYPAARNTLVTITQNAGEKPEFREAALYALYSGDHDNIAKYVSPILQDKSATARLQVLGIQMVTDQRRTMAYRRSKKARRADPFDQLVKNAFDRKGVNKTDEVIKAANEYLLLVKPNFVN